MQKRTIRGFWELYKTRALPKTAPQIQIYECRLAFYGGTTAILGEMIRIDDSDLSEAEALQTREDLLNEIKEFRVLLLTEQKGRLA